MLVKKAKKIAIPETVARLLMPLSNGLHRLGLPKRRA
jgi:hypothetical protein